MSRFVEVMNRVNEIYIPGVDKFYSCFKSNPWLKADEELNAAMLTENNISVDHALYGYESKKARLIELYKQFLDVTNEQPKHNVLLDTYNTESKYLSRNVIVCDSCKKNTSESKYMLMRYSIKKDELGDPVKKIITVCYACNKKGEI